MCVIIQIKKRVLVSFYFMNKVKIKFVKKEKSKENQSIKNLLKKIIIIKIKLSLKCCHITSSLCLPFLMPINDTKIN